MKELLERYDELAREFGVYEGKRNLHRHTKSMETYASWCEARQINARLFMRFRFETNIARHGAAPGVAHLVSDDAATEYERTEASASLAAFETKVKPVYDLVGRGNGIVYTRVRDAMLPPAGYVERFRLQVVDDGRAWACRSERSRFGGGFDPRSSVCPRCPEASLCASQASQDAGFDIAALRRGDFARLPALVKKVAEASHDLHEHVRPLGRRTRRTR